MLTVKKGLVTMFCGLVLVSTGCFAQTIARQTDEGKLYAVDFTGKPPFKRRTVSPGNAYDFARLEESITILEEVGDEYEAARSYLTLASILAVQNQPDAAQKALTQCLPVFTQLEAMLDLQQAQALQTKLSTTQ